MNERVYKKLDELSKRLDEIMKEAKGVAEGLDRVMIQTLDLVPALILWENMRGRV